ncbi:DUF2690 domain-containing protein [Micromonospora narathiwatensis]|uniref:DUF2690 domain-containing protein n=1 Tax=Micromonospora narathiwatensis TaxID=299146 RepID=A0A1A9A9U5_9ACTN|nr:DUF2690 domain-containing protein [Micromonospora narathiwatensis]SBT53241.1 Protein of unknown function (DUF2690) [Micromonospora narathiwatensis]
MTISFIRRARGAVAAAALAVAALAVTPGAAVAGTNADPDLCRNGGGSGYLSCNGKDPSALGCNGETKASVKAKNGVFIELRYSSTCQAYWTRYTNSAGGSTGTAWIRGNSVSYKKDLAAYANETGWTPMAAANQNPRACLVFRYAGTGEWLESCAN